MLDILCLGDVTCDIFLLIKEAHLHAVFHPEVKELCVKYGGKIPVSSVHYSLGGNAGNSAVGFVRLGLTAALETIIGDDYEGKWIYQQLKKEKVNLDYLVLTPNQQSNQSVIIDFQKERTIFSYHAPKKEIPKQFPPAKWLYLTSAGREVNELHGQIKTYLKNTSSLIAFNPGTYEIRRGLSEIEPIIRKTEILFLNREEAESLKGKKEIRVLLEEFLKIGARKVVITDGEKGAYGTDGSKKYFLPALEVEVVEKTGAGDSFAVAFIGGIFYGQSVADALKWGAINAASVISSIGHLKGLLAKKEIEEKIKINPDFEPKEI